MKLSKTELSLIADILKEASDEFSNHSCNDYKLSNTPEHKELLIELAKWNGDEEYLEEQIEAIENNDKKTLYTYDWMLMRYLSEKCAEASK